MCLSVCLRACVHVYVHMCVYVHTYACGFADSCVCLSTCSYMATNLCVCVLVCLYIYVELYVSVPVCVSHECINKVKERKRHKNTAVILSRPPPPLIPLPPPRTHPTPPPSAKRYGSVMHCYPPRRNSSPSVTSHTWCTSTVTSHARVYKDLVNATSLC